MIKLGCDALLAIKSPYLCSIGCQSFKLHLSHFELPFESFWLKSLVALDPALHVTLLGSYHFFFMPTSDQLLLTFSLLFTAFIELHYTFNVIVGCFLNRQFIVGICACKAHSMDFI